MSSAPDNSLMPSFRYRIAQRIAGAIVVSTICLWFLLRIGFCQVLLQELDATLRHDAKALITIYQQKTKADKFDQLFDEFETFMPTSEADAAFAALLDAHGNVLFKTSGTPTPVPRVSHTAAGASMSFGTFRILEMPVERGARAPHAVLVGGSLQSFQEFLHAYDRYSAIAVIVFLVLASIVIYWLAEDAVYPFDSFVKQAEQLHADAAKLRLTRPAKFNELDRLAKVINQLLERITSDVYENRHLLADAAHQLRTPLAAIRSSVEVVLAGHQDPASYTELLAQVVDETESLEALVNQLLLLTETDSPPTSHARERVAFDQLVQRSVDMFEPVADSHGVAIWVGAMARAEVLGNRHHLRQVINNLLENAMKFTAAKSANERRQITVELTTDPQHHQAQLKVVDTGIGIGPEHLNRIFDRFYRADQARSREQGVSGNGLGLSIVKAVVESHGGTVRVESTLGVGTSMIVTLPLIVQPVVDESVATD